jgi:glutathione S-transferase
MALALYGHPFSSYTQKALIALHENDTAFEFREIGADYPDHVADWLARWPLARFPLLIDAGQQVAESSIIIEHLQLFHPGPVRLIPADPAAALEVRFLDRVFDLHVMNVVQIAVDAALGRSGASAEHGRALARERLECAYGWLEGRLQSLSEVFRSIAVPQTTSRLPPVPGLRRPGLSGGGGLHGPGQLGDLARRWAAFGYALLFVALLSNIMAILLQALCARLAIASGRDLAQACRDAFPRWVSAALGLCRGWRSSPPTWPR